MSYFIINTAVANIYKEPAHNSAVVTQALMGESGKILDYKDEWYHIRQNDGYEGWLYYFYGIESNTKYDATLLLHDLYGTIVAPDKKVISQLVFGSCLQAKKMQDGFHITLPDGRNGISVNNFKEIPKQPIRENIIQTATRFLGTPYFWGGKTPYGVDCSGLVQTVFKSLGVELPRDAYQQEKFLSKNIVDEDKIKLGDLLFFSEDNRVTHVAISTGGLNFINARGFVQEESIDEKNPKFNRKLRDLFLHAVSIEHILK